MSTCFDFDEAPDLAASDALRWQRYAGRDVIPLWIADTDFRAPECVRDALAARVGTGIYAYASEPADLRETIVGHLAQQYGWHIHPDWLVLLPGVVPGLHAAVRHLTAPRDHVLVPRPVYPHLLKAAQGATRALTELPLALCDNRWQVPSAVLRGALRPESRLLMVCNPHNPGGTVLRRHELEAMADIADAHDLWICSDEIHADLVLDPALRHIPIASLSPEISRRTVTLMSVNKVFNFPGAGLAWAVAENPVLREAMGRDLHAIMSEPSLFGYVATRAALQGGAAWHLALLDYLRGNRDLLQARISAMPGLRLAPVEATYLAWIDASALGIADPTAFFLAHGVALSPGSQFGADCGQFVRLNFGTQRARLTAALDRMEKALSSL